jgi:hypothetical protein
MTRYTVPSHTASGGDHDADELERWLELSASGTPGPNGTPLDEHSLAAAALRAHARIAAAERQAVPAVPADAMWESIMASTTPASTSPSAGTGSLSGRTPASAPHRVRDPFSGSHWAVSAALVALVVIGTLALYRSFAGDPVGGDPTETTNSNLAMAPGTPDVGRPDPALLAPEVACDVTPLTLDEVSAILAETDDGPPRQYGPLSQATADEANAAAWASRLYEACGYSDIPGHWRALATERFVRESGTSYGSGSYSTSLASFEDWVNTNRDQSTVLLANYDGPYYIESSGPYVTDVIGAGEAFARVLLPGNVVRLADGRVGGPMTWIISPPDGATPRVANEIANSPYLLVDYMIFASAPDQPSRWQVDEYLPLCTGDCDQYYELLRSQFPSSGTSASPEALSGDAAWLAPYLRSECDLDGVPGTDDSILEIEQWLANQGPDDGFVAIAPTYEDGGFMLSPSEGTSAPYTPIGPYVPVQPNVPALPDRAYEPVGEPVSTDAEAIARVNRVWQACKLYGGTVAMSQLQTDRFTGPAVDITYDDATTGLAQEILSGGADRFTIRAGERGTSTDQGYDILSVGGGFALPSDMVLLSDGRVAAPMYRLVSTTGSSGVTRPTSVEVRIFAPVGGRWLLDEIALVSSSGEVAVAPPVVPEVPDASPVSTPAAVTPWRPGLVT